MTRPAGPADLPHGTSIRKVLFVDLDGVRYDRLLAARTPAIDALAAAGQLGPSYLHDTAIAPTNSGPGHATMLTGVWPDKHRVLDNSCSSASLARYPDVFSRLRAVRPDLSTFATADWAPLNEFLLGTPHVKLQPTGADTTITDRNSTAAAVRLLTHHHPDVLFVYQHAADDIGHELGDEHPDYLRGIETIDGNIGALVRAIEARPTRRDENWLILVGTDHGFAGTGHGGDDHSTRTGWLLANGGDVPHVDGQAREWRQPDVAATILRHLRVPIDPAWDLDGIPIGTACTDPFDTVAPTRGVVDESAKPPFSGGWSPRLPAGWTRPATTRGGATEFRGWQLMTGEFWATSGEGAGRGSFVRGRDTVAVADQALWNRTGAPASAGHAFDSTLNSPWQVVRRNTPVTVSYQSHLRQPAGTGGRAELIAEFDNGTHQVLWVSDAKDGAAEQISVPVTVTATVPAGARQMRIGWKLSGGTDGYWAVDDPQIRTA